MSYISAFFYDRLLAPAEEACLKKWRHDLLRDISGDVFEIGAGTGSNLEFYPDTLRSLVLSEPDVHMRRQLEKKITSSKYNASVTSCTAENIEAEDESCDFVVTSLVCCSVGHLESVLLEVRRVLKPRGKLVFLEHVAAPQGTKRRRWQNLINPFWRKLAGNCHLNRETESAILNNGFEILEIKRESMRKAMPLVRPTIRGTAIKC
ncbi:MAG: class I SAM-dependent methyltransferase [Gammaproteobacteria bacterium]|nr:class I SAM-dependent methyltransferase [Gammaproteobacteria bacterium]